MPQVIVYLASGRSLEQKKAMMLGISEAVSKHSGSPIEHVTVQIIEAPLTDKMAGGETFAERRKRQNS